MVCQAGDCQASVLLCGAGSRWTTNPRVSAKWNPTISPSKKPFPASNVPSYCEDYCVNYQFEMYFYDVMSSVEWLAEALSLKDSAVLWVSIMGLNQHSPAEDLRAICYQKNELVVDRAQSECHSFLLTAGATAKKSDDRSGSGTSNVPFGLTRLWRLYSLECAARLGQDVYVACNSGVMACTKLLPNGHSKFGVMDPVVTESMYHLNIQKTACIGFEDYSEDVMHFINGPYSCGEGKLKRRLQRWAAFHLVSFGVCSPECLRQTSLEELISLPGFCIHSELAKGGLGKLWHFEVRKTMFVHVCSCQVTNIKRYSNDTPNLENWELNGWTLLTRTCMHQPWKHMETISHECTFWSLGAAQVIWGNRVCMKQLRWIHSSWLRSF